MAELGSLRASKPGNRPGRSLSATGSGSRGDRGRKRRPGRPIGGGVADRGPPGAVVRETLGGAVRLSGDRSGRASGCFRDRAAVGNGHGAIASTPVATRAAAPHPTGISSCASSGRWLDEDSMYSGYHRRDAGVRGRGPGVSRGHRRRRIEQSVTGGLGLCARCARQSQGPVGQGVTD